MLSRPRPPSWRAGTSAAGQVILSRLLPGGAASRNLGKDAAAAPAGQRPRPGTRASSEHETRPAGSGPVCSNAEGSPGALPPSSALGRVAPPSARTAITLSTPWIRVSRASSGASVRAGLGAVSDERPSVVCWPWAGSGWPAWSSTRTLAAEAQPIGWSSLASCVVMPATATVVMNRARTRPLTARNAARGSSASRRAAISAPGRLARRAMIRAPAIVSQGPAMTRPIMISRKPGTNAWICPAVVAGRPCTTKKPSSARPASSGSARQARGGFGVARRVTPSGEICTRRSASRATSAAATGTPIATDQDVWQAERQVAGEERLAGERDRPRAGPQQEEQAEAGGHTRRGGHRGLHGGDDRDLPRASRRPGASRRTAARGGRRTAGSRSR